MRRSVAVENTKREPDEKEQQYERLVQRVITHLNWVKGSRDRRDWELRAEDSQNFWKGDQWSGIRSFGIPGRSAESKKQHANPVDNLYKAQIEGLVGDICDRPVDIQIKPPEPGDEESARKMERTIQHIWYVNRGDRKLEFIVRRAVLYGPLVAKVYWDPDWRGSPANPFVGEVRFFGVNPANLFVDPRVKAVDEGILQQASFVIYAVRRSLAYIRKMYPERGGAVTADGYASYVDTLSDSDAGVLPEDMEALLIEYWYKGQPLAPEFPERPQEPSEPQDMERADGVHVAVVAGGVLLRHSTYVYPWYPFALEWMYPSDDSIYGYGDGYDMMLPQLVLNKLNEIAIEGAALQSKGNWVTDEGNIRNVAQFRRYASVGGAILPVADAMRIRRELGGNVPNSLFVHYRQEQQTLETITGRFDISQGRAPRNIRAASAIAMLLNQGAGRVRQRARAMSSFVRQMVEMMIYLVTEYYTEERLIRILGKEGQLEWDTVSRADFLRRKVFIDPETGEERVEEYIPEFDVLVTAGTDTPASKAYFSELALQLFQAGVIDEIALLEQLEFPRWREVLARKQQQVAQQQAVQQAGAPPPGAPPGVGEVPPEMATQPFGGGLPVTPEVNPYAYIGGGGSAEELEQLRQLIEGIRSAERGEGGL